MIFNLTTIVTRSTFHRTCKVRIVVLVIFLFTHTISMAEGGGIEPLTLSSYYGLANRSGSLPQHPPYLMHILIYYTRAQRTNHKARYKKAKGN